MDARRKADGRKLPHDQLATLRDTPPVDVQLSRQVSWLAGRRFCLAFPVPMRTSDTGRTAARRLQLRGQRRSCLKQAHQLPS